MKAADPAALAAVCEQVKAAVVADDAAGTVTFNNTLPWGPFLATLTQSWGMVLDQEWAVAQGAWDGDCATWQNYYAPGSENSELTAVVNGTGPTSWITGPRAKKSFWLPMKTTGVPKANLPGKVAPLALRVFRPSSFNWLTNGAHASPPCKLVTPSGSP
ncbi:MAG: hypothetical protein M5U34_12355 [Chloroflexi bacterium]|nr:hypothetical protein [Chloroflexota bacterium]